MGSSTSITEDNKGPGSAAGAGWESAGLLGQAQKLLSDLSFLLRGVRFDDDFIYGAICSEFDPP